MVFAELSVLSIGIHTVFYRSIGATVVEMLTKNPPWHELEPMAALFKIAKEGRAKFTLGDHVSTLAHKFIEQTFLDETNRPNALALLQHPFVSAGPG